MQKAVVRPLITAGNRKLKRPASQARPRARRRRLRVFNFNQPAGETCPGASRWCLDHCYALTGQFQFHSKRYRENRDRAHRGRAIVEAVEGLPAGAWCRIHAAGDFDTPAYIERWRLAASLRPDVRFWGYTRSWRVARLAPALERLRDLANVTLFASVDPSITERPPAGWRVAWIDASDPRVDERTLRCPEQTGRMSDCADCGFCILSTAGDIAFLPH